MTRRTIKRLLFAFGTIAAIGFVVIASFAWYYLPLGPFLDDGPFHGVSIEPVVGRAPDQTFPIFNEFSLEVFDPMEGKTSPVVQLRDSQSGMIRWAIRADGLEPGDVKSIRFDSFRRGPFRSGRIAGTVRWTYGQEAAVWFITGSGELRDYWYSW